MAYGTAKQLIHRNAQRFALDVPDRLVDVAQGGVLDDTASIAVVQEHDLSVPFDHAGVVADDVFGQVVHGLGDGRRLIDQRAFAPSVNAFIRLNLDEQPVATGPWPHMISGVTLVIFMVFRQPDGG